MSSGDEKICRMTRLGAMPRPNFEFMSGLQCYRYLSSVFSDFQSRLLVSHEDGSYLYMYNQTSSIRFDPTSESQIRTLESTMSANEFRKWRDCHSEAMRCCDNVMSIDPPLSGILNRRLSKLKSIKLI